MCHVDSTQNLEVLFANHHRIVVHRLENLLQKLLDLNWLEVGDPKIAKGYIKRFLQGGLHPLQWSEFESEKG